MLISSECFVRAWNLCRNVVSQLTACGAQLHSRMLCLKQVYSTS
jgi:hypothetical protein